MFRLLLTGFLALAAASAVALTAPGDPPPVRKVELSLTPEPDDALAGRRSAGRDHLETSRLTSLG